MRAAAFEPAWWLPGPHAQTIWAAALRRRPPVAFRFETFELADGDRLELAWHGPAAGALAVILHGLEGCCHSNYASGIARALAAAGWRCCVLHFRGCGGRPNRHPRTYHSGDTADLAEVLEALARRAAGRPIVAVGYSLGGNVLLKYLATQAAPVPAAAVAVSVPFELGAAAAALSRGLSRVYQRRLLGALKRKILARRALLLGLLDLERAAGAADFFAFDDAVTAPLHGFAGVAHYYQAASSRQYLPRVRTPTLALHARDDPFMAPQVIPEAAELGPGLQLEIAAHGGHVGFVGGASPRRPVYWLERRIPQWLASRA